MAANTRTPTDHRYRRYLERHTSRRQRLRIRRVASANRRAAHQDHLRRQSRGELGSVRGLAGKLAVVTGGARGIGEAIATRLLEEGAAVEICDRDADALAPTTEKLSRIGDARGTVVDVADDDAVARYLQT